MEVINLGTTMKIAVPSTELKNIFDKIDEDISIDIKPWVFKGTLKKINSKMIKDEDGEKESYKELTIEVYSITREIDNHDDLNDIDYYFSFPDKKTSFTDMVKIDE